MTTLPLIWYVRCFADGKFLATSSSGDTANKE